MSQAAWELPAEQTAVAQLRRSAVAFAAEMGASEETLQAIALAVSEVVTNAVIHAYAHREPGNVTVRCRAVGGRMVVEVVDEGIGVAPRTDSPGLGHGLATVGAVAQTLDVSARPEGPGTVVRMSFGPEPDPPRAEGLERLCALALESVADASCVDVISDGVLRRIAAEVAGDADLTEWLRGAVPPAKPGTATWDAMRADGPKLVVHDPTVPRSPGGPGETLGLTWWVAVHLETALWGFGGREGGRPVPSEDEIRAVVDAARAG